MKKIPNNVDYPQIADFNVLWKNGNKFLDWWGSVGPQVLKPMTFTYVLLSLNRSGWAHFDM